MAGYNLCYMRVHVFVPRIINKAVYKTWYVIFKIYNAGRLYIIHNNDNNKNVVVNITVPIPVTQIKVKLWISECIFC